MLEGQQSPALVPADPVEEAEAKKNANTLAKIYSDGGGFRDFVQQWFSNWWNKDLSPHYLLRLGIFVGVLAAATIAFIIAGVYLVRVKANGPAILSSQMCGLWVFNRTSRGDEAATRAGLHDLEKERRAGEYAQNCYRAPERFDAVQCNFLYKSRLQSSGPIYDDCPFQNDICALNQTVTFETNYIDASELGINSRHSPKFRHRTSCTPLSMEYPYIKNETVNGTTTYYYFYGEKRLHKPPVNYTYVTTGDPFDRLAPAYDVL